ncbi:MAG: hypothetical protein ABI968_10070, partial [Acidobacteriota bacterium]
MAETIARGGVSTRSGATNFRGSVEEGRAVGVGFARVVETRDGESVGGASVGVNVEIGGGAVGVGVSVSVRVGGAGVVLKLDRFFAAL